MRRIHPPTRNVHDHTTCRVSAIAAIVTIFGASGVVAQAPERPFGTLREQAAIQQAWLAERMDTVLPQLLRDHDIHMWVVPMREYNEDPVFRGIAAPTTFAARRRSVYVFFDRGEEEGVERLAIGGTSQGGVFEAARMTEQAPDGRPREFWGPDQWRVVAELIRERDPRNIAVNISPNHNFADGLTAGEWEQMHEALGPEIAARVVRAEHLALNFLAIHTASMDSLYQQMQRLVHEIIATGFSEAVITPGQTTTEDVVWWFRQRVNDLGLGTWFQPSVDVQRAGVNLADSVAPVIQRGDVLHCDFGLVALGLSTDTQHMGYVLREGETAPPDGLMRALHAANALQDLLLAEMRHARTGNEMLRSTLAAMRDAGIDGTVYTHPIGFHGHGAGPLIGLWDRQDGVPGRGDVPIRAGTWHSIELQATTPVPEWDDQPVRMMLEEEAELGHDGRMRWVLARQEQFHLVR